MSHSRLIFCIAVFAAVCFGSTAPAGAQQGRELKGTYTPNQVKSACDKVGGEYFPQGQTGTYGCENHNNGSMVLCNKHNKCTGYTQARTTTEHNRIIRNLKLGTVAPVRK
jgi:hypothetical protein